ncbi:G-protein coupled receptor moody [Trachymyrmex septentrionalis]|uniref:G-protein coupled receptor moody n=1 Tax=Trachymyrmex septentrionalis TaxID=34720 RepID=A0A195F9A1_9HYME|nr:PREDICTED: protein trapped in endoderm-1 [Trachymyrmex septentrionalis]KYN37018.1 G-protein coupled receptor moody [Trachymyrmex septentrionalis]
MLKHWWMTNNETGRNSSDDLAIEEMLQDPGSVILFVDYPRWLLCFAAACCILFMLVGIPGNLITVIALFRTKKLKNATAVFIMNLSISDLMFCCFNLPLATSTFWHRSWLHGPLLCRLFPLLRYGLVAVSLFSVLAITINRYVMIGHPSLYSMLYKTKFLIPMVLAIWIIAFGLLVVTWFERFGRFGLDPVIGSCTILPDINGRSPKEFLFVLAFLIPCLAIIVCYARIFYIVRETASKSRSRVKIFNVEPTETSHDQPSIMKNQEQELSVLCVPFSSMQVVLLNPNEGKNLELPSTSANEDSSSSKQLIHEQKTNDTMNMHTDDQTTNIAKSNNGYDASEASLSEDIPFVDERAIEKSDTETKLFFNRDQCELQWKLSENPCGRLGRLTGQASFIVETSLQRIAGGEHSNRLSSRSLEEINESHARKAFRRQSKFMSVGRKCNGMPEYATPRMSAKDRKLLQMILVIFVSFLVCYLPITVTKLLQGAVFQDWQGLNIAGYILIYLTTCINPVIYVVMSSEYRSAYRYVLLCKR